MINSLKQLGMLAMFAGVCLVGATSAQAQDSGYTPPHVDTSGANAQPIYPVAARTNAEEGTVAVDVLVNEAGKAGFPRLAKSSGFEDLDNAAIAAVLNWKYVPAMHNGVPESERTTVAVNFKLPSSAQ